MIEIIDNYLYLDSPAKVGSQPHSGGLSIEALSHHILKEIIESEALRNKIDQLVREYSVGAVSIMRSQAFKEIKSLVGDPDVTREFMAHQKLKSDLLNSIAFKFMDYSNDKKKELEMLKNNQLKQDEAIHILKEEIEQLKAKHTDSK